MLDNDRYFVSVLHSSGIKIERVGVNSFILESDNDNNEIECVFSFTQSPLRGAIDSFNEVYIECLKYWKNYWIMGGFVDLSECTDKRDIELERRIILSQYLTAVQCTGSIPPQETGLTFNSWYGKFHLEMHWWPAEHFPLWGRKELLEKSMWWYQSIIPKAREIAKSQGYNGARWPKMPAYDAVDSPYSIAPLLIWHQPHPIYYAELIHKSNPSSVTLEIYRAIVLESAEFMASFFLQSNCFGRIAK